MDVAFLVSKEGIEQAELTEPWKAVEHAGHNPQLISPEPGKVQAFHHLDPADSFTVDMTVADARAGDFGALVLPGGVANGDLLRWQPEAVEFVREFAALGRPIAVICHGGWVLIEAEAVSGKRLTSWPSLRTDFRNAGATWVDEPLVVDGNLISSRKPDDLPMFNQALTEALDR
ncbi:type 1 glutamine amidotransferase domain-containing protein [Dactylosporangium matsuzakiense]|uniref:Glutamine amidotransferase n=1 Tax=Dactylosporangium matsuzakiense TaxID=53360 RepID=A0A9W6KAK0_9ACTN|nr:type 1 glutamine amidotransferase domain-containing protein [Dactylosporangium matsuzakiense]UWZ47016.1 type 1 glutamine amidotransferase [Dactylosporangium matsuzakiense]GLK98560.1 glutamine amidotransferase [Dactylosporangium matsuzakiense]